MTLHQLTVAQDQQRKGYGEILLVDALQKTLNVSHKMGIAVHFADAQQEQKA